MEMMEQQVHKVRKVPQAQLAQTVLMEQQAHKVQLVLPELMEMMEQQVHKVQ
jgi:hypothetical protein